MPLVHTANLDYSCIINRNTMWKKASMNMNMSSLVFDLQRFKLELNK